MVFGASGYLGCRLVPELLEAGHEVRAAVRTTAKLDDVPWRPRAEIVRADVTDAASVAAALDGQDVVYYLVHALHQRDFVQRDRLAAHIVADASAEAGVRRIVYLGGLTPPGKLSDHLASRAEVGRILLESGVPTAVLRAAIVVGSGSASFEMLRHLTERLPAMVTPRWVHNRVQPIAVRDVLHYLVHAADLPPEVSRAFDIGGPDVLTYLRMMRRFAAVADLPRRVVVPVPVLTPRLSAQWIDVVTPVPRRIAVPLVESLVHEVVCREHDIAEHIPDPEPTGYDDALRLALAHTRRAGEPWPDPLPSDPLPSDPAWSGGSVYEDVRECHSTASPDRLWAVVESIGGHRGWWPAGEPRVLRLDLPRVVPGRGWLELSVTPEPGGCRYRQRAVFEPRGLAGHLYWKAGAPVLGVVFAAMAQGIARLRTPVTA
ncbi:SDR family oxidoreductase [Amycolatopsis endophytica]